jgi:hypothetical protein
MSREQRRRVAIDVRLTRLRGEWKQVFDMWSDLCSKKAQLAEEIKALEDEAAAIDQGQLLLKTNPPRQ